MPTVGFPGAFPGGLTTGNLAIGAVQKQVTSAGFPGTFPGGLTIGYRNIGAVQKAVAAAGGVSLVQIERRQPRGELRGVCRGVV